ncbi:uncharacterized protein LOC142338136 [Convolutriloba macropyga]|uniref:uncharacterized protein LOC142338136 n=1 Tax=Convolutriloba macropyga TaxID=536237 RepID=UPI003F5217D8
MSNLFIIGLFLVCIILFLVFGCPVLHYIGRKCRQLFHRSDHGSLAKEFGAEQFFVNTAAAHGKSRKFNFDSAWLQNRNSSNLSVVPYKQQARGKRDNFRVKLPITTDHLAQILRPAALATFLNVTQNPSRPPPPEILSHQAIEFSPIIVETLFSRVRSKPVTINKGAELGTPGTSQSNQHQQDDKQKQRQQNINHQQGTSGSNSKRRSSPGIRVIGQNNQSVVQNNQQVAIEITNNPIPANACQQNWDNSGIRNSANSLNTPTNQQAMSSWNDSASNFTVSPAADSIIISSQSSSNRKPIYSKNVTSNSNGGTKRITGIQVVQPGGSRGHKGHLMDERRKLSAGMEPALTTCCTPTAGQRNPAPCLSGQKSKAKTLSFHDSLPVLNDVVITNMTSSADEHPKISSLHNIDAASQSFCVTEV